MGDRTPVGDNGVWRKSSYSMSNGQCVEMTRFAGGTGVGVRDSQAVAGGVVLRFGPVAWAAFLSELRASSSSEI